MLLHNIPRERPQLNEWVEKNLKSLTYRFARMRGEQPEITEFWYQPTYDALWMRWNTGAWDQLGGRITLERQHGYWLQYLNRALQLGVTGYELPLTISDENPRLTSAEG